MKFKYGIGLLLLVLGPGGVARADAPSAGTGGEVYVTPGYARMNAGDLANSFSLDAGYLKQVHPIAWFGYEAGYVFGARLQGSGGGTYSSGLAGPSFTSDTHVKILHLSPEIKLGPTLNVSRYQVNPYVIGGGGFYWTHLNGGTATLATGGTVPVASANDYNGGWSIGAGFTVNLPGAWSVGFDLRRQDIVNKDTADTTWFTPALRFALHFS